MKLYRAIIEDNNHPDKNGKVRVRIHGIHTVNNEHSGEDFNYIKTDELPWAEVMGSVENGLVTGLGLTKIPLQGTMVWVLLENDDINYPIVVGTITGNPIESPDGMYSGGEGFSDPAEEYPRQQRLNEPETNRLARNEDLNNSDTDANYKTIHSKINLDIDDVGIGAQGHWGADVDQIEPPSLSDNVQYPKAAILETPSGHVIETDDTSGNERIRVYHRTGSYIEIKPDGSLTLKTKGESTHIIHEGDVHEHIKGNYKRYVEGTSEEVVDGNIKSHSNSTYMVSSGSDTLIHSGGNIHLNRDK